MLALKKVQECNDAIIFLVETSNIMFIIYI